LFPSFVSRRPLPRFPVIPHSRHVDIEEGEDEGLEGRQLHFGTGSMWASSKQRSDAWKGGWWTRFVIVEATLLLMPSLFFFLMFCDTPTIWTPYHSWKPRHTPLHI
jgi:hypothetical protein